MVECSFMSGCGFESHCSHKLDGLWFKICMTKVYTLITIRLRDNDLSPIVSSRVETPLFLRKPPFWVPPSFWSKFKKLPPLSESHPNWCMKIVRNTIKWRCYVSYYTKSIENIINITLFTFRLNSVFTTDTSFG